MSLLTRSTQAGPLNNRFISLSLFFFSTSPSHPSYIDSHLSPFAARYDALIQDLNYHAFPSPSAADSSPNGRSHYVGCRRNRLQLGRVSPPIYFCLFTSIHLPSPPSHGLSRDRHWCYDTCLDTAIRMAQDLGTHRNEDALLKIGVFLLSLSLAPRNSKNDIGLSLAMSLWIRSSLYNKVD